MFLPSCSLLFIVLIVVVLLVLTEGFFENPLSKPSVRKCRIPETVLALSKTKLAVKRYKPFRILSKDTSTIKERH